MKLFLPYVIVLNDGALTFISRKLCHIVSSHLRRLAQFASLWRNIHVYLINIPQRGEFLRNCTTRPDNVL